MKNTYGKLFRTSVFGGYKKKDVRAYIGKLEEALTEMEKKLSEQKENGWNDLEDLDWQSEQYPSDQEPWLTYEMGKEKGTEGKELGNVIIFGDNPEA